MVGNAAMAVAALLAPRCSLAYSHEEVREGQLIPEGSRSEQGTLMGVGPQLCDFYEKALFVKPTSGGRCVVKRDYSLPFARYASFRCEYAIGGCRRRSQRGLSHLFAGPKVP
jgi:hypothetical protein